MDWLRSWLEGLRPRFAKGGPYERFYVLFEMLDGFLFSPPDVTHDAPHVRDGIDLKRVMVYVVWALGPCILVCLWNTGYQANTAMANMGIDSAPGWRGAVLNGLGVDTTRPVSGPTCGTACCTFYPSMSLLWP